MCRPGARCAGVAASPIRGVSRQAPAHSPALALHARPRALSRDRRASLRQEFRRSAGCEGCRRPPHARHRATSSAACGRGQSCACPNGGSLSYQSETNVDGTLVKEVEGRHMDVQERVEGVVVHLGLRSDDGRRRGGSERDAGAQRLERRAGGAAVAVKGAPVPAASPPAARPTAVAAAFAPLHRSHAAAPRTSDAGAMARLTSPCMRRALGTRRVSSPRYRASRPPRRRRRREAPRSSSPRSCARDRPWS